MSIRAVLLWIPVILAGSGCASRPDGRASAPRADVAVALDGYVPATRDRLAAAGWRTDVSRREVPLASIRVRDLTRDAIVPVRKVEHAAAADVSLDPAEPVLVVRGSDAVRGWPLAHLLKRELALDDVDGVPVAVTFCSLCGTARVWDRRMEGETLDLAVSGMLLEGNSLLFDRGTDTLWRQIDGRAVAGALTGRALESVPSLVVSFGALRRARPDARVMLPPRPAPDPPFRTMSGDETARGEVPDWMTVSCPRPLEPMLAAGGEAFPVAGPPVETRGNLVVFRDPEAGTAYRTAGGGPSGPRGAAVAFRRDVEGRTLTFRGADGDGGVIARDEETGSSWNLLGEAVAGPLAGRALRVADQVAGFRFAVSAPR